MSGNAVEEDFEKADTYSGPAIPLSPEKEAQYAQLTRNLQEITSAEIVRKVLSQDETLRCYWGGSTATSLVTPADR